MDSETYFVESSPETYDLVWDVSSDFFEWRIHAVVQICIKCIVLLGDKFTSWYQDWFDDMNI